MPNNDDLRFSKNVSSYISVFIVLIIVLLIIIGTLFSVFYIKQGMKPLDEDSSKVVQVEVPTGASSSDVSQLLEDEGIIKNSTLFQLYLRLNSISEYQAGQFELSPSMDYETISKTLETGVLYEEVFYKVTVPEGYTVDEIGDLLEEVLPVNKDDFIELVQDEKYLKELQEDYPDMLSDEIFADDIKYPLEGYLYPATYDITKEQPDLNEIVRQMLDATRSNSFSLYNSGDYTATIEGEEKEFSFHEFLTFASLVEKEATSLADRAKITSVFLNRLGENPSMPLQTDPTVLYAKGIHKDVVLYEDLEVDDPFNTYIHKGLTPGPIASPGPESVQSILNPANTDYFYFLADKDGNNHFAETYEEHQKNREKYIESD
ncbi:MAG TPA: endolytic transglycosylase MltG [Candidatus Nosocomiicoccus stercorigallinarum]|nr:endolytic transglycosylase MltG [Candidatus Nosocomiicoccus stercorigallinarum]